MKHLKCQKLARIEVVLYFIIWLSIFSYCMFKVYSDGMKMDTASSDFSPGWKIINNKKDVSDSEWELGTSHLIRIWPWILLHMIGAEIIRYLDVQAIPILHLCSTAASFLINFKAIAFLLFIFQFCIFLVATYIGSKTLTWILSIILLVILNFWSIEFRLLYGISSDDMIIIVITLGWFHIRCLDFALSEMNNQNSLFKKCLNLIAYNFYLPSFYLGPFIPYNDFKENLYRPYENWNFERFLNLIKNLARIALWYYCFEILTHFFYCHHMHYEKEIFKFGAWTTNGVGICMSQLFYLKYFVIYGFSIALAKAEGYKAPPPPKCINRIHLYSEMWRSFDRGFYIFLYKCIYKPICDNDIRLIRRLFASFVAFGYVFLWHGINKTILLWSILNFIGIACETFGSYVQKKEIYKKFETVIKPSHLRRIKALICSPLWIMAVLSNMVFFAGFKLGIFYIYQICSGDFKILSIFFIVGYCMSHISMEITLFEYNKIKK